VTRNTGWSRLNANRLITPVFPSRVKSFSLELIRSSLLTVTALTKLGGFVVLKKNPLLG
jgi:hypothetical protein